MEHLIKLLRESRVNISILILLFFAQNSFADPSYCDNPSQASSFQNEQNCVFYLYYCVPGYGVNDPQKTAMGAIFQPWGEENDWGTDGNGGYVGNLCNGNTTEDELLIFSYQDGYTTDQGYSYIGPQNAYYGTINDDFSGINPQLYDIQQNCSAQGGCQAVLAAAEPTLSFHYSNSCPFAYGADIDVATYSSEPACSGGYDPIANINTYIGKYAGPMWTDYNHRQNYFNEFNGNVPIGSPSYDATKAAGGVATAALEVGGFIMTIL